MVESRKGQKGKPETAEKRAADAAEKRAADAAARYAARQHRYRAQNIARTELTFAYNAGACGAAKDAQAQGYIGDCVKIWLTAYDERVCPICSAMDDEKRSMDELFSNGKLLPPAHPSCRCAVAYKEIPGTNLNPVPTGDALDGENSLTETDIDGTMRISGARITDQHSPQAIAHADRYYGLVRSMKTDVAKIAANTGYPEEEIQRIKDYIFMDVHDLGEGRISRFDSDFAMAQSWQRLIAGTPEPHDLTLLKHEIMERQLMLEGLTQDEAHIRTSLKYNYKQESDEFYAAFEKHQN